MGARGGELTCAWIYTYSPPHDEPNLYTFQGN